MDRAGGKRVDRAASRKAIHAGIGLSQIDLVENIEGICSKAQIGAFRNEDDLGQANVGLEKAGSREGITTDTSDLTWAWALPGANTCSPGTDWPAALTPQNLAFLAQ